MFNVEQFGKLCTFLVGEHRSMCAPKGDPDRGFKGSVEYK